MTVVKILPISLITIIILCNLYNPKILYILKFQIAISSVETKISPISNVFFLIQLLKLMQYSDRYKIAHFLSGVLLKAWRKS